MTVSLLLMLSLAAAPPLPTTPEPRELTTEELWLTVGTAGLGGVIGAVAGAAPLFSKETEAWTPYTLGGGMVLGAALGATASAYLVGRGADAPFAAGAAMVGAPVGVGAGCVMLFLPATVFAVGTATVLVTTAVPGLVIPPGVTATLFMTMAAVATTAGLAAGAGGGALVGLELGKRAREEDHAVEVKPPRPRPLRRPQSDAREPVEPATLPSLEGSPDAKP